MIIRATTERVRCPCSMPVTKQDYKKISRGMPPRVSRHILVQCLGMSEEDLDKVGYLSNWDASVIDAALNA